MDPVYSCDSTADKFIPVNSRGWTSSLYEPELESLDYKWFTDEIKVLAFVGKGSIMCMWKNV